MSQPTEHKPETETKPVEQPVEETEEAREAREEREFEKSIAGLSEQKQEHEREKRYWKRFEKIVGNESPNQIISNYDLVDPISYYWDVLNASHTSDLNGIKSEWKSTCYFLKDRLNDIGDDLVQLESHIVLLNRFLTYCENINSSPLSIKHRVSDKNYVKCLNIILKLINLYKHVNSGKCARFLRENNIHWRMVDKEKMRNDYFKPKKN